jgi:enoyl-CoA hydratase
VRHDAGTDKLLVEVAGRIATVTFNNPAKRNALSADIRAAIPKVLAALDADDGVRVVVVTGAGDKSFASGADISEFGAQRTAPEDRAAYDRGQAALVGAWSSVSKPVIAMIRGFCLGGGLLTALQADIRIASQDSQFRSRRASARRTIRKASGLSRRSARRPSVATDPWAVRRPSLLSKRLADWRSAL